MRVISKKGLRDFIEKHADAKNPLEAWYTEITKSTFLTPQDIKNQYPSASFLANNRVVFNISGNHYRIIIAVDYDPTRQACFIKFIGTHAEYDKIDAKEINMY